jgi:hypothetical protein
MKCQNESAGLSAIRAPTAIEEVIAMSRRGFLLDLKSLSSSP